MNQPQLTPTPRTDAASFEQHHDGRTMRTDGICVDSDFARQLERELAEAQDRLAWYNDGSKKEMAKLQEQLREANAKLAETEINLK